MSNARDLLKKLLDRALDRYVVTVGDRIQFRTSSGITYVHRNQVTIERDSRGVRLERGGEDAVADGSYTAYRAIPSP